MLESFVQLGCDHINTGAGTKQQFGLARGRFGPTHHQAVALTQIKKYGQIVHAIYSVAASDSDRVFVHGIRRDENEAHVARFHFDEIERHALQIRRAGSRDQNLNAVADEMFVGLAFLIKTHAVIHAAIIFLISRHAQTPCRRHPGYWRPRESGRRRHR